MYYCKKKKNKQVEEKILAKKKKNENEICPGTAAKKYNIECNNSVKNPKTKLQKIRKKTDNKKSAHKQDIEKLIKLEKRERQCKNRKNIQKICVSEKDNKSLRK